jgi:hypothetical protein
VLWIAILICPIKRTPSNNHLALSNRENCLLLLQLFSSVLWWQEQAGICWEVEIRNLGISKQIGVKRSRKIQISHAVS